ncbi:MAG: pentapeptide repeat-containing protein [Verrucomicrobiota bacterium]|nr:pentapeptide repeat-containing protein [Verrucomicrobiota bacterium]
MATCILLEKIGLLQIVYSEGRGLDVLIQMDNETPHEIIAAIRKAQELGQPEQKERQNLKGMKLTDLDLSDLDLSGFDFSDCEMSRCNLSKAKCPSANFDGATLYKAKLDEGEFLGATFRSANLSGCSAKKSGFGMSVITSASFFDADLEDATFVEAQVLQSDFRAAKLSRSRFFGAYLDQSDFSQADLGDSDLRETNVEGASFNNAILKGAQLRDMRSYSKVNWIGTDIREIDFSGAYLVRRHVIDENFLHEFRHQDKLHQVLYWGWNVTSKCGRSMTRWGLFLALNVLFFACVYWAMDQWMLPGGFDSHLKGIGGDSGLPGGFIPYLYFSVVTFTTLGFGDLSPLTVAGQVVLIVHITIGYLGLGALLSILATKFASRGN